MKHVFSLFIVCIATTLTFGQTVPEIEPSRLIPLDFSPERIEHFNGERCEQLWDELWNERRSYEDLSEEESQFLDKNCNEMFGDVWQAVGDGCSWYCGAYIGGVTASSTLSQQGENNYDAENAYDLNYKTAWVEGVKGYGIGEYLEYTMPAQQPRITTIIVVNGYVKSESAYNNNSRVKKLRVYWNDEPVAILKLEDQIAEQHFVFDTLGYDRDVYEWDKLDSLPDWTLKFEILEVYEGSKWDDVVISEIYFDGIDVHCFAEGTQIAMADGSTLPIEFLSVGDEVQTFNSEGIPTTATVLEMAHPTHCNLVEIEFSDGTKMTCTPDHPLLSASGNWLSVEPEATATAYLYDRVGVLDVGSEIATENGVGTVTKINRIHEPQITHTIVRLSNGATNFIANGVVVGTEILR